MFRIMNKFRHPASTGLIATIAIKQLLTVDRELRERERYSAVLFASVCGSRCYCAEMSSQTGDVPRNSNGLLLYYHQYSYYSQKVVMALHEKHLPFQSHIVNLTRGEQYDSWFLKINSRGEVPVLQDTGKIIPDSARIIDYLEDNFSNGETPRLVPMDQGGDVRQKVTYFRQLIDKMPAGILTMGSLFHPELIKNPKLPFRGPVRTILANGEKNSADNLRKTAENNPDIKHILLQKASFQETKHKTVQNKEEFLKVLDSVDLVLDEVEKQLSDREPDQQHFWLVSDRFTVADIALTIFLERLYELGFESRFWTDGKRPHIEKYFERARKRDSYKKTVPNTLFFFKSIVLQQNPIVIGVSVVAVVAIIAGGFFAIKKLII